MVSPHLPLWMDVTVRSITIGMASVTKSEIPSYANIRTQIGFHRRDRREMATRGGTASVKPICV